MAKVTSKRADFLVDALFYFEPVERFEYRSDTFSFADSSYCATREFCSNWRRGVCFCGKFR